MTAQSKTTIKTYFEQGDKPTAAQFINLIDSYQDANTVLDAIIAKVTAATSGQFILSDGAASVTALPSNLINLQNKKLTVGASANFTDAVQFNNVNVSGNINVSGNAIVSGQLNASTIRDWHYFYQVAVVTATTDWVKSTPYPYTLQGIRRVGNGNSTVSLRKNGTSFVTFDVSSAVVSAAVSAAFAVGDTLDIVTTSANAASAMAIYAQITRAL